MRLLRSLWRRYPGEWTFAPALVGGLPGVAIDVGGTLYAVTGVEVVDGRVTRITSQLNPAKLRGVDRPRDTLE